MRRLGVTLILSAMLPLIAPVHADAFWRWLDDLSGPGKFHGADADLRLWCFGQPRPKDYDFKVPGRTKEDSQKLMNMGVQSGCLLQKVPIEHRRKASIDVMGGYQLARYTHLAYETERDRSIYLISLRSGFWLRLARPIEVGASAGIYAFNGTDVSFFGKFGIEPITVDVKPIALFRPCGVKKCAGFPDTQYDQLLSVRVGLLMFPGGFDATKFGARSFRTQDNKMTDHVKAERIVTISIYLDLEPAFRLRESLKK